MSHKTTREEVAFLLKRCGAEELPKGTFKGDDRFEIAYRYTIGQDQGLIVAASLDDARRDLCGSLSLTK